MRNRFLAMGLISALLLILYIIIKLVPPEYIWSRSGGGEKAQIFSGGSSSLATDESGNVYVVGRFSGKSIKLGNITLNNNTASQSSTGFPDIFITKYNKEGEVVWAKCIEGLDFISCNGIAIDPDGYFYIAGSFMGASLTFPTQPFSTILLNETGFSSDIFLAKYDTSGKAIWAKRAGGNGGEVARGIDIDSRGNIYIIGSFGSRSFIVNTATPTQLNQTSNNNITDDIFIIKYNPSGDPIWAKCAGGNVNDYGYGIAIDNRDNVFITGTFGSSTISFDNITLTNTANTPNTEKDVFLAKLDSSGSSLWAIKAGGLEDDIGSAVVSDGKGNVYLCGSFESDTITFGSREIRSIQDIVRLWRFGEVTNTLFDDFGCVKKAFIAKYDALGFLLWTRNSGGCSAGNDVAADSFGNAYITGLYSTFQKLSGIFVSKISPTGDEKWLVKTEGEISKDCVSIEIYDNHAYITGWYNGPEMIFGNTPALTNSDPNNYKLFVAKLKSDYYSITRLRE